MAESIVFPFALLRRKQLPLTHTATDSGRRSTWNGSFREWRLAALPLLPTGDPVFNRDFAGSRDPIHRTRECLIETASPSELSNSPSGRKRSIRKTGRALLRFRGPCGETLSARVVIRVARREMDHRNRTPLHATQAWRIRRSSACLPPGNMYFRA